MTTKKRSKKKEGDDLEKGRTLYVRCDNRRLTTKQVRKYFSSYGEIEKITFPENVYHRYFFVLFKNSAALDKLLKKSESVLLKIDGNSLTVQRIKERKKIKPNIYYCNHCGSENFVYTGHSSNGMYKYNY